VDRHLKTVPWQVGKTEPGGKLPASWGQTAGQCKEHALALAYVFIGVATLHGLGNEAMLTADLDEV
jgi:hypothetical protein